MGLVQISHGCSFIELAGGSDLELRCWVGALRASRYFFAWSIAAATCAERRAVFTRSSSTTPSDETSNTNSSTSTSSDISSTRRRRHRSSSSSNISNCNSFIGQQQTFRLFSPPAGAGPLLNARKPYVLFFSSFGFAAIKRFA